MLVRHLSKERLPPLTSAQIERLRQFLAKPPVFVALPAFIKTLGVSRVKGIAILIALSSDGLAHLEMTVYHGCKVNFVTVRPWSEGFQPTPWTCTHCKKEVTSPDDLKYDIRARLPFRVEIDA